MRAKQYGIPKALQPKIKRYSDETLLQLVAQHNMAAYQLLYDRHAPVLFSLLVRMVSDSTTAESLLQEVFWQIWDCAKLFPKSGEATVWMIGIARKYGLEQLRRQRGIIPALSEEAQAFTAQQHSALELAFFEGLSVHEIARQTNTEVRTILVRIRDGLEGME